MIKNREQAGKDAAFGVADLMVTAAITAPKGCGEDNVRAIVISGDEKDKMAKIMHDIAVEYEQDFFDRDANNIDGSQCVVLIGVEDSPIGLTQCGTCGFENCGECKKAGSHCAFNITDLGIAVGSAVSVAADNRIDNRVLYSAGKAALRMGLFNEKVKVCYAIPLSTHAKSNFFDRLEQAE